MRPFRPVVMLAHGINTHGLWQKTALEVFADAKFTTRTFEKYISVPAFLMPWKRKEKIAQFLEWYGTKIDELHLDLDNPYQRPSVVAHGFGTWFVSRCMLKHPEVRIDKMILLGGIQPSAEKTSECIRVQAGQVCPRPRHHRAAAACRRLDDAGPEALRALGMELTGGKDKHGHPIYELDLLSPDVLKKKYLFAGLRKLVTVMQQSDGKQLNGQGDAGP